MSNQAQPTPQPTKSGSSKTSKASSATAKTDTTEIAFDSMKDLDAAVTEILLNNQQKTMFLDVTADLMKSILKGLEDQSATYKGVRLFVSGKREKILAAEKTII